MNGSALQAGLGLIACCIDALPCLAFALERADLNDPSGMGRGHDRLDCASLLEGLRLGARRGIGVSHRLREGGELEAGSTPSRPLPVPWLAGCGGISVLATSALLVSALATTALEVSGTSARSGGIALVTGVAGWDGPAEAIFICPALMRTVLTLTGFIGSDEPGIAAIGWV